MWGRGVELHSAVWLQERPLGFPGVQQIDCRHPEAHSHILTFLHPYLNDILIPFCSGYS